MLLANLDVTEKAHLLVLEEEVAEALHQAEVGEVVAVEEVDSKTTWIPTALVLEVREIGATVLETGAGAGPPTVLGAEATRGRQGAEVRRLGEAMQEVDEGGEEVRAIRVMTEAEAGAGAGAGV